MYTWKKRKTSDQLPQQALQECNFGAEEWLARVDLKTVPSVEERTYLLLMVDAFYIVEKSIGTLPVLGFPTFERGPRWRLGRWGEMKFKMRSGRTNDDSLSSAGRPSASSVPENSRRVNTNRPSVFRPSPPRPPIPVLGRHRRRRPRYYHRLRHLPPRRQGRQGSGGSTLFCPIYPQNLSMK